MALVVQKFGGSSLADPAKVKKAAGRAVEQFRAGNNVVMVVSAMGDRTDDLIELARQLDPNPDPREMDMLMAVGEQMSIALMAIAIHSLGYEAISLTGAQAGIHTNSVSSKAKIRQIDTGRLEKELQSGRIVIVAGFQGVDAEENITTLGRGGSDTTAVALAAALQADRCDIYTDVDGIFTTDPGIVPEAHLIEKIDYDEMLELASLGAKVIQSRSVEIAKRFSVPFRVRPSAKNSEGTLVINTDDMEQVDVRGAALEENEAKVTIRDVPDSPGAAARIFGAIASEHVNVDVIVQNVSAEGMTDLSFTVPQSDLPAANKAIEKITGELGCRQIEVAEDIAKVSIVGVGMKNHTGVARNMFSALAESGINIGMISTSEIKVSVVIDSEQGRKALKAVHEAFGLSE